MRLRTYILLSVIVAASFGVASFLPVEEMIRGAAAVPGIAALIAAIWQVLRDAQRFEKDLYLQTDQQIFALGANSHMSTVAFDKHVAFCEGYMRQVDTTTDILFREGPTDKAIQCAKDLFALHRAFAAWIPKSMALELRPFEDAIHKIGVDTHLVRALSGTGDETRSKAIERSYSLFSDVLSLDKLDGDTPDDKAAVAAENVKERIREILGINELLEIRRFVIARSINFVRGNA